MKMRMTKERAEWLARAAGVGFTWGLEAGPFCQVPHELRTSDYLKIVRTRGCGSRGGWRRVYTITDTGREALAKALKKWPNLDNPLTCTDCGAHHGKYVVLDAVWRFLVPKTKRNDHMCLTCLNARSLKKRSTTLLSSDFKPVEDAPVNDVVFYRTLGL